MILNCLNDSRATEQIAPTIGLRQSLDVSHPDVLQAHNISPADYHPKLVFRSAIESIRGTFVASSMPQRHGLVASVLEVMKRSKSIADYESMASRERFDFEVLISENPREAVAVEVKGGEGNSVNISERPLWASEFIVWSHLDGAIVNPPSHGANAIIFTRAAAEMVKRHKRVDAVFFKDARCNTAL